MGRATYRPGARATSRHKTTPMEEAERARRDRTNPRKRRLAGADVCGKVQGDRTLDDTAAAQDLCRVGIATVRDYKENPARGRWEPDRRGVRARRRPQGVRRAGGEGRTIPAKTTTTARGLLRTRWRAPAGGRAGRRGSTPARRRIARPGALATASALASGSETPPPCSAFQQLLRRRARLAVRAYLARGRTPPPPRGQRPVAARFRPATELLHHATTTACSSPEVEDGEVWIRRRMDAYTRVELGGDAKARAGEAAPSLFHRLVATMSRAEFADGAVAHSCRGSSADPQTLSSPRWLPCLAHAPCQPRRARGRRGDEGLRCSRSGTSTSGGGRSPSGASRQSRRRARRSPLESISTPSSPSSGIRRDGRRSGRRARGSSRRLPVPSRDWRDGRAATRTTTTGATGASVRTICLRGRLSRGSSRSTASTTTCACARRNAMASCFISARSCAFQIPPRILVRLPPLDRRAGPPDG